MMNVLSTFDGISCGQVALHRAGFTKYKYFASEVDKNAVKVTQTNWPETVQVGDVCKLKGEDVPAVKMAKDGISIAEISDKTGIAYSSVGNYVHFTKTKKQKAKASKENIEEHFNFEFKEDIDYLNAGLATYSEVEILQLMNRVRRAISIAGLKRIVRVGKCYYFPGTVLRLGKNFLGGGDCK